MGVARPALLQRVPRLWWRDPEVWPPVPKAAQSNYSSLADDFAFLDEELLPVFVELDGRAQREQNRFRRQQLLIFVGGFVTTAFGAAQAAFADVAWPGMVVAITGAAVGALTFVARQRNSHRAYLQARLCAERLRSLYFLYLGRVAAFADDNRRQQLISAVEAIRHGREAP